MRVANYLPLCALAATIGALPINQGTTGPDFDINSQSVTKDNQTVQIGSIKAGNAERIGFGIGEVATGRDNNELVDLVMAWPESDPQHGSVGAALTRTKPLKEGDASHLKHLVFKDKDAFKTVNFKRGLGDGLALDIQAAPGQHRNVTVLNGLIKAKPLVNEEPSQGKSDGLRFTAGEYHEAGGLFDSILVVPENHPDTDATGLAVFRKKPLNEGDASPIEYIKLAAGTTRVQVNLPTPTSTESAREKEDPKLASRGSPGPWRWPMYGPASNGGPLDHTV